jgi:malonyl-CoA O-methyltransferase
MLSPPSLVPPLSRISRFFGRKASAYEDHATVQSELIALLAKRLSASGQPGGRWVDLGCGTGMFADASGKNGLFSRLIGVDISFEPLVIYNKKRYHHSLTVQADISRLPLKNKLFDAAVTASTLQWLDHVPDALKDIAAILKNGGLFAFSVFVQGSFRELFAIQRQFGVPVPVRCPETAGFVRALQAAGFEDVNYEEFEKTVHAPTAAMALKNISAIGGTATAAVRMLNRKELMEFCGAYEAAFGSAAGVPLTYRAVIGRCRKGRCL